MSTTITLFETVTGRTVGTLPCRMMEGGSTSYDPCGLTLEGHTTLCEAGWWPVWSYPGEKWGDWIVGVRKAAPAGRTLRP